MIEKKTLSASEFLRIDKNFAYHITSLKKYVDEERLLKDLIIYMSYSYQRGLDLFGRSSLDPYDFCKKMKVDRTNLMRTHPDPLFFKVSDMTKEECLALEKLHKKDSSYKVWDSFLENALFILKYEKTITSYSSKDEMGDRVTLADFSYIKELSYIKGPRRKHFYEYIPTEEFENSLKSFFINGNIDTYILLRKTSLEDFYLKLLNRIEDQEKKSNYILYKFREFAELLNISTDALDNADSTKKKTFSDIKKKINYKFNKNFIPKLNGQIPDLSLSWIAPEYSKVKSIPKVSWRKRSEKELTERNNLIYNDIFYTELFKELSSFFYANYGYLQHNEERQMNDFLTWLFSMDNFDVKKSNYISIYAKRKGDKKNLEAEATDFFSNLIEIGNRNKLKTFIWYKDRRFFFHNIRDGKEYTYHHIKDLLVLLVSQFEFIRVNYKV